MTVRQYPWSQSIILAHGQSLKNCVRSQYLDIKHHNIAIGYFGYDITIKFLCSLLYALKQ